ncbi:MAG: hypothetical protein A2046_08675 [Bacteroidetes bacterium GWA2_30_7]|nr:MAG: hypothetical protein A2046_08675 [Bacteroidetes bacterium GWA2_30_7]
MKTKALIFRALLILLIIVSFVSCKKMKENRIEGTWKYVSYSSSDQNIEKTWAFSNNGDFIQTTNNTENATTSADTGIYLIRVSSFKTYLEIFDTDVYTDGKYRVVKLSGKLLKTIQTSDGSGSEQYIRKDFTKE